MGIMQALDNLIYGPGHGKTSNIIPFPVKQPETRTSLVFDSHVQEASGGGRGGGRHPQAISLAWDERDAWGLDTASRSWQGLTPQDRKAILLDIYINNPWVSACIDVISKRICSGGFTVEKVDEEAKDNQQHYDQLMEFLLRVNDDWDFLQYARSSIIDELIYGETYTEILWQGGLPYQLVKVDCLTMDYKADQWGRILQYKQQLSSTQKVNWLDPKNIIRWWFPHPRASIDPFAPAEKVSDAVLIDKKMMNWMTTFFQKGAKFSYYIKGVGDMDEADRFMTWYRQNFTGEKNAHVPPITWGNAEFAPLGNQGGLEMDFQKGLDRMRVTVFAAYGVPPAAVAIIESGSIGGGTGEDQDKSLQFNACDPVKQQFLEKLNYRIVQRGFNIQDYRIGLHYADYRNDKDLAEVADKRVRNGTRTINETRAEEGKKPYKNGGSVAVIVTTKEVTPVPRLDDIEDEQRQTAQQQLDQGDLNTDLLKTKVDQAKNPPPPPPQLQGARPVPGQPPQGPQGNAANTAAQAKANANQAKTNAPKAQQGKAQDNEEGLTGTWPSGEQVRTEEDVLRDLEWLIKKTERRLQHEQRTQSASQRAEGRVGGASRAGEGATGGTSAEASQRQTARSIAATDEAELARRNALPATSERSSSEQAAVAEDEHHTGMMLAFMLDPETAKRLALPGGELPENMHVTLAYLGDMDEAPEDDLLRPHTSPERLITLLNNHAYGASPQVGTTGGIARFINLDQDVDPIVLTVNIPGLQAWRNDLVERIEDAGYFVAKDFDYTPHISLAFIPKDAEMPVDSMPPTDLYFDTICLKIGDEQHFFKMGEGIQTVDDVDGDNDITQKLPAIPRPATQEDVTSPADTSTWQKADKDVQARLKQAREDGYTHGRWGSSVIPCDACLPNMGKTVKLGEAWPSGAYYTPQHGNCGCGITLLKEGEF